MNHAAISVSPQLQAFAENVAELFCYADTNQQVIFANSKYEEFFGVAPGGGISGRHIREVIGADSYSHVQEQLESTLAGQRVTFEMPVDQDRRLKVTNVPDFDDGQRVVGFFSLCTDITGRRDEEDRVRASEEWAGLVLDATSEGIWDWNVETGDVYFSPRWMESLGYSPDEVTPHVRFWKSIVHPGDWPRTQAVLQRHLEGRTETYQVENRLRTRSGCWRWNLDRGKVVKRAPDGRPLRMVGTDTDISSHKEAEASLTESRERLRALAARLMSVQEESSRHLARELHDVSSQQLAVLTLDVSKLKALVTGSVQAEEVIERIQSHIDAFAREIHDVSRRLHPSIIDDLGLIAALKSQCRNFSKVYGIPIDCTVTPLPGELTSDIKLSLYRIVQEALNNIARHSGANSVQASLAGTDSEVVLSIHDCGEGFDVSRVKGTGRLGLVGMEERARSVGGTVSVDSEPGSGTTVEVRIPLKGADG